VGAFALNNQSLARTQVTPWPRRGAVLAMAGIVLALAILSAGLAGFRVNTSPSEPLGLWRIRPLDRPAEIGDLVFICPPDRAAMRAARERGYLHGGPCPGGYAPLIKSVAAVAGQFVSVGHEVGVDGIPLKGSAVRAFDGVGRALTPFGGGKLQTGDVFLFSRFAGSFDSRYFGPISAKGILGVAQSVLTYAP
jgi:conjugative transfer signal peptidase TraF